MATTVRIDQINQLSGFPVGVRNVPPNYPSRPTPDKLSLLWKYNNQDIYHRFSPYTNYHDSMFSGVLSNQQPFVYTYIDKAQNSKFNQLPEFVKGLASATNITPDTLQDVVRVSKFLVSSWGLQYSLTQGVIQRTAPFDETRVYNPLSPILATIQPLTLGLGNRPMRHIEGGILTGILNSITSTIGINFQSGFVTPKSTTAYGKENVVLPASNLLNSAKGLIRGGTANPALLNVNNKWTSTSGNSLTGLASLFSSIKQTFKTYFGITPTQPGIVYRSDEQTYEKMRVSKGRLDSYGAEGYLIPLSTTLYWPGNTYRKDPTDRTSTTILVKYDNYIDPRTKLESKFNYEISPEVQAISDDLKAVIASLKTNPNYLTTGNTFSKLLSSGETRTIGVDYRNRVGPDQTMPPNKSTPKNQYGVIAEYNVGVDRTVDISVSPRTVRMATSFRSDALNQLGVLGVNKKFNESNGGLQFPSLATSYPGYTEYKPYEDDLIAFFFYDVVNQKYIPFRATVKGISEGNTAFWDELRFIGRSDQLYSYNGFSRTLSFTFNIVISSLSELLPTWQKVNYMASCVKPSNYTTAGNSIGNNSNKFIVPPMFMLTIGDLYKFQPIVVTSINVNIPDDATWETLNELNTGERAEWSYLNGQIRGKGTKFAQLPKEAEIAVTCNLLEKERAVVGGSHFGHAPRADDGQWLEGNEPTLPSITSFGKEMTVDNIKHNDVQFGPFLPEGTRG